MKSKAIIKIGVSLCLLSTPAFAWQTACNVSWGAIKKDGDVTIFKPSKNGCGIGGKQRTEVKSKKYKPSDTTYNFETNMSIDVKDYNPFTIFQLHDQRKTCAPALKVEVLSNGRLKIRGDEWGPTEAQCGRDKYFHDGQQYSRNLLPLDGSNVKLNVVIDMEDDGTFDVELYMNDQLEAWGSYDQQTNKKFHFQHGVYAQRKVDFVMKSNWELTVD